MSKSSKKSSKKHGNGHGDGSIVVVSSVKAEGVVGKRKSSKHKKKAKKKSAPAEPAFRHDNGLRIEGEPAKKLSKKIYNRELKRLQLELVKLQEWVLQTELKVVVIFEGRDAAGKGGTIKRIMDCLNPRHCKVVALGKPTEREKSQWYFQRYVQHLPAAGEIVLFDRSWYNRAGVERVMGFCTDEEYFEFLRSCPEFECAIKRSGIILLKYWFSVSSEEQERRFMERSMNPSKRWKLSPMDLEARTRWVDYSKAKDAMFEATDIKRSPWYVVNSDVKKKARLNCIAHILSMIPYRDLVPEPLTLPPRQPEGNYLRPPTSLQTFVPEIY